MGTSRVYFSLNTSMTQEPPCASLPSCLPESCWCPHSHRLALKLSCAGLILLLLTVIGLSVLKEGQSDCAAKGATLLLIQDQEELKFVKDLIKEKGNSIWTCLNYSLSKKNWRWINGSTLSSDVLRITGEGKINSCASISKDKEVSEDCISDYYWICQKEPKHVSETRCNDS
ncbi:Killer cell lectin-like receptor subfamily B member 1A [Lemmus lemmus]